MCRREKHHVSQMHCFRDFDLSGTNGSLLAGMKHVATTFVCLRFKRNVCLPNRQCQLSNRLNQLTISEISISSYCTWFPHGKDSKALCTTTAFPWTYAFTQMFLWFSRLTDALMWFSTPCSCDLGFTVWHNLAQILSLHRVVTISSLILIVYRIFKCPAPLHPPHRRAVAAAAPRRRFFAPTEDPGNEASWRDWATKCLAAQQKSIKSVEWTELGNFFPELRKGQAGPWTNSIEKDTVAPMSVSRSTPRGPPVLPLEVPWVQSCNV